MYSTERMGERGDPWGVPLWMLYGSNVVEPILSDTFHPFRKERTQSQTCCGKPLRQKTWVTRSGLTLLKKPDMLKSSKAPTLPVALVAYMRCTRVAMVLTALWCGCDPNCDMDRRLAEIMSAFTLLVTIFSRSLAVHLRRLIGR
jgi:hypothetical protein